MHHFDENLADIIGVEEAILVQQLYDIQKNVELFGSQSTQIGGYTFFSIREKDLREKFKYISRSTLNRTMSQLAKNGWFFRHKFEGKTWSYYVNTQRIKDFIRGDQWDYSQIENFKQDISEKIQSQNGIKEKETYSQNGIKTEEKGEKQPKSEKSSPIFNTINNPPPIVPPLTGPKPATLTGTGGGDLFSAPQPKKVGQINPEDEFDTCLSPDNSRNGYTAGEAAQKLRAYYANPNLKKQSLGLVKSTSPISDELLQDTIMVFCKKELADKIGQKFTRFALLNSKLRSYLAVASRKTPKSAKISPVVAFSPSEEGKTIFRMSVFYQKAKSVDRKMFDKKPLDFLSKMLSRIQKLFGSAPFYKDLQPLSEEEFYRVVMLCPSVEDFKNMILKSEKKYSKNYKSQFDLLTK